MKNAHAVLGTPIDASPDVVRRAYRDLVRRHHPDRDPSADATQKMAQINQAYQSLLVTPKDKRAPRAEQASWSWTTRTSNKRAQDIQNDPKGRDAWPQALRRAVEFGEHFLQTQESGDKNPAHDRAKQTFRTSMNTTRRATPRTEPVDAQPKTPGPLQKPLTSGVTSDSLNAALEKRLEAEKISEARKRTLAKHSNEPYSPVVGFHKAQRIGVDQKGIHIFLGSRGTTGRNIVAVPELSDKNGKIQVGKTPKLFAMNLKSDGGQTHTGAQKIVFATPTKQNVTIHFSDQNENLRTTQKAKAKSQPQR